MAQKPQPKETVMTDHLDHMLPPAEYITEAYRDANKLEDKRVLSTVQCRASAAYRPGRQRVAAREAQRERHAASRDELGAPCWRRGR